MSFARLKVIELLLSKEHEYNLQDYNTVVTDILKEIIESKEEDTIERCYHHLLKLSKEE